MNNQPNPLKPSLVQTTVLPQSPAMSFAEVKDIWVQAGGNPRAADMAAAVADASSGLNPGSTVSNPDGTQSIGLWLIPINGRPPGSTDPLTNARAAVALSHNGTNWCSWCVAWSDNQCGKGGGTYLGEGSDALGALGQTGAYNVIGAQPTGSGTSASNASGGGTSATSSKLKSILIIVVLIAIVYYYVRKRTGESSGAEESQGRSQAGWTPDEEALLGDTSKTDKQLSSETGRSIRAIRVRRNQIK